MEKVRELLELTKALLQRVKKDAVLIASLKAKIEESEKTALTEEQEKEISQLLIETKELLTNTN